MKQIFETKEGTFDFTNKKVRLNGKVLDKFSLCASMERLDFKRFQFATLYTYDVCNYETIKCELYDYLTENEVTETETTTNESVEVETETTTNESVEEKKYYILPLNSKNNIAKGFCPTICDDLVFAFSHAAKIKLYDKSLRVVVTTEMNLNNILLDL